MKKLMAVILTATLVISVGASNAFATEQATGLASGVNESAIANAEGNANADEVSAQNETGAGINAEKITDNGEISAQNQAGVGENAEEITGDDEISAQSPADASESTNDEAVNAEGSTDNEEISVQDPAGEETNAADTTANSETTQTETPNYVGMNESDIQDVLNAENSNVIVNYVFSDEAEGTVVGQSYNEAGQLVIQIVQAPVDAEAGAGINNILSSFTLNAEMGDDAPSLANGGWEKYATWYDNDNMNQAESAAKWGAYGGNGKLQGQKYDDAYNNDLSHLFGLYADGDNVHVYIKYSALYNGVANGNDYQIKVDGTMATYRIGLEDGREITWTQLEPGTYNLKVYNDHGSISGSEVLGACGQIVIKENNLHNEMELVIPMTALKDQNDEIDLSSYSVISFFTPNLMEREIACAGASSGPVFFAMMTMLIFLAALVLANKKGIMELDVIK